MTDEPKYSRDIEESDEVLDAVPEDPIEFWQKKQKDLVTSTVDYNLNTLTELFRTVINDNPSYQRRLRWDEKRQSRLIESFLMNVPVPPIFLNEDEFGQYSIIDGKQRLTAIHAFVSGNLTLQGLTVFADVAEGRGFHELPPKLQNVLKTRTTLRAIIILRQSDPDIKFEVFERLNTGGVKLNPQEIRNSAFAGTLNDLILSLSENRQFHKVLGIRDKKKSSLWQEMRDAELVLRYFAFRKDWVTFSGGMKRHMDHFMFTYRNPDRKLLKELRDDFLKTLDVVDACFDGNAFNRWQPEKGTWRRQVLASLYDAQMFACQGRDPDVARGRKDILTEELKKLFEAEEFRRAIDAATNTPSYFRARIELMSRMLDRVLGGR